MVEIAFLGTGGAFSAGKRSNLALLIESPGLRMLVEAGPVIMQQLARANRRAVEIEHLFVSHAHGDHALGFPMLVLNRLGTTTPLHVYAGSNTIATLRLLWSLAYPGFDGERFRFNWHMLPESGATGTELIPGVALRTAAVPFPAGVPTLAARWDFDDGPSLTYVTDTFPNPATVELARGCDLLIHEASFSAVLQPDAHPADHFHSTARQAGEMARQAGCPRLALVHLDQENGEHPDVLAEEARAGTNLQVIVPEDGERIQV